MAEATHESMDTDVLCDAKTFETKVGLIRLSLCHNILKLERRLLPLKKNLSRKCNSNNWKQIKSLVVHHHTANVWAFFVVNNQLEKIIVGSSQTLRCVICHPTKQCHSSGSTTRFRKGLVTYNLQHGITSTKNHIGSEHGAMVSKY